MADTLLSQEQSPIFLAQKIGIQIVSTSDWSKTEPEMGSSSKIVVKTISVRVLFWDDYTDFCPICIL